MWAGLCQSICGHPYAYKCSLGSANDQSLACQPERSVTVCVAVSWKDVVTLPTQEVPTIVVGTHLQVKAMLSTEEVPQMSEASTQMELIRQETSVQTIGCNKCPEPYPGEKVRTCKSYAQVDDLLVTLS